MTSQKNKNKNKKTASWARPCGHCGTFKKLIAQILGGNRHGG
jgi:hypothetical protein